jgi:hypothetical protein
MIGTKLVIIVDVINVMNGGSKLFYNGLQIGDGRDFQHYTSIEAQMLNLPTNCQTKHEPRLLQMCCYRLADLISTKV